MNVPTQQGKEDRSFVRILVVFLALLLLPSCIGRPLLGPVQLSTEVLRPTGAGETLDILYEVGCEARVSLFIADGHGEQYRLRNREPRKAGHYTLQFDGTVPVEDPLSAIRRRLLPAGTYTVLIQAESERCGQHERQATFTIHRGDLVMPDIENLVVFPETISPNADAIADVTEITYRLPTTATVDLSITSPEGRTYPIVSRAEQYPAEHLHVWDGKRPDGGLLPNGVYTYTLTAEDRYGNIVQRRGTLRLVDVGLPEATITYARIAPKKVMLGSVVTVTVRVKNTGQVPIRTYGPPSGTTYTTNEVFSSIEHGRYAARSGGFWRVGMDWDANSGDGPKRYPFRWALSRRPPEHWDVPGEEDWLQPGEEVEVIGRVIVLQRERKMGFYVGLIQDGVGFFQNHTARTIVEVGF